nr:general stress protein [uncultured Actinomyces sp.]
MAIVMEPKMPTGTEVASYQTYAQARAGVDFLSDYGFDVSSITIVGTDLHMVERVTGRLTIARASMSGASSGGLWGALAGMFMSAGQNAGGTGTWVVGGIVIGALVGMALSALAFILRGRNRDLLSSQQVVAERYAILAASDIDRAFTLLQRTPGNMARPKRAREVTERPKKDSVGFFPDGRPRFGAATKEGDIPSVAPEASAASSTNEAVAPSQVTQAVSPVSSASESEAAQTAASAQPASAQPAPEGRDDAPASSPEGDQAEASDQRS